MPTGKEIVEAARKYLDVPYHHQGRNRRYGIDCVGILEIVADDLGMFFVSENKYKLHARPGVLHDALLANGCEEISKEEATSGCIATFWYEKREVDYHAGILVIPESGEWSLIHSSAASAGTNRRRSVAKLGRVTEHPLGEFWEKRYMRTYRHREQED